jgi:hypothetical protein
VGAEGAKRRMVTEEAEGLEGKIQTDLQQLPGGRTQLICAHQWGRLQTKATIWVKTISFLFRQLVKTTRDRKSVLLLGITSQANSSKSPKSIRRARDAINHKRLFEVNTFEL